MTPAELLALAADLERTTQLVRAITEQATPAHVTIHTATRDIQLPKERP
jgi:hypothetical protein